LITLEKEEYNPYDKVIVTINAPEKNENPTQADTIVISLSNQSDPLATIRLFETGQDNGIFEGSFILTPDMARTIMHEISHLYGFSHAPSCTNIIPHIMASSCTNYVKNWLPADDDLLDGSRRTWY